MTALNIIRPDEFPTPTTVPLVGTLLDAVDPQNILEDTAWVDTEGLFVSYNCLGTDYLATLPCPANTLDAPVQTAAGTATTGGTLAADTYFAVITAINSRGETVASNEISRVTTGATSTITWNWNDVVGATGYRIYVTSGASGTETFLIQLGDVNTYVWTGTPAIGVGAPPTINTAVEVVTKTFESPSWQDGLKIATYSGIVCKAPGFDVTEARSEQERVFSAQESVALARALLQNRFVSSPGNWSAATDLTPAAGAVDPHVGLAILEGHAAANYSGRPTVHVSRTIGSLLMSERSVELEGDTLVSRLGSKVAADGGYDSPNSSPTGAAPAAGEQWIYASGEVMLARSAPIARGGDEGLNRGANEIVLLREREYVLSVDCYTSAVRVKVQ